MLPLGMGIDMGMPMPRSGSNCLVDGVVGDTAGTGCVGPGDAGVAFMKPNADPGNAAGAASAGWAYSLQECKRNEKCHGVA